MPRFRLASFTLLAAILTSTACDKHADSGSGAPSAQPAVAPAAPPLKADPGKPKVPGPSWKADQVIFEFGEVWGGELVTYPFRISNEGSETLKILEAKPKCSCSVAEGYSKEIAVGGSGFIPFKLNTAGKKGPVDESITIKTNDPVRPDLTLRLRGVVKQLLDIEVIADLQADKDPNPKDALAKIKNSQLSFGVVQSNQQLQRTLRMKNASGKPLILKMHPIAPQGSPFSATFQETSPGEEFILTVTGDPPFAIGSVSASVPLETNIPGRPIYTIGINLYVPARVDIMPPSVVVDPNYPYVRERTITVTNYGSTPIQITGLATSDPAIKLEMQPPQGPEGKQFAIKLTLPEPPYSPPPYGEVIRVETSDAERKVFDLQVLPSLERAAIPRPDDKPLKLHPWPLAARGQ